MKVIKDIKNIKPLKNRVWITDIEEGEQVSKGGIIIPDDDRKDRGIRPRWCKVFLVGSEITQTKPGDYLLMQHGRWTRGVEVDTPEGPKTARAVDWPNGVLMVTKSPIAQFTKGDE